MLVLPFSFKREKENKLSLVELFNTELSFGTAQARLTRLALSSRVLLELCEFAKLEALSRFQVGLLTC